MRRQQCSLEKYNVNKKIPSINASLVRDKSSIFLVRYVIVMHCCRAFSLSYLCTGCTTGYYHQQQIIIPINVYYLKTSRVCLSLSPPRGKRLPCVLPLVHSSVVRNGKQKKAQKERLLTIICTVLCLGVVKNRGNLSNLSVLGNNSI